MEENHNRLVVGTFNCTMQVTQQRSLTITGHIYSDDTPDELNQRIDSYQDAMDRQFVRCDIINKTAQIAAQMAGIRQFRDQLEDLASRQKGVGAGLSADAPRPQKLSSQEKLALQNGEATIQKAMKNIEQLEAEIAEAKRKIAIAPSPA